MNKSTLMLVVLMIFGLSMNNINAQDNALKGSGEVFFHEEFDWADPDDPKGWKMPEGYMLFDPDDIGYNWMWHPYDSIVAQYTAEPPFNSTSHDNGYLALPLNYYNNYKDPMTQVNNAIQFPTFDCSSRTSVVLRFETHFMNGGDGQNEIWVSNDAGVHWAAFDCGFGTQHKDRPNDAAPGAPVIYEANISEVAAGAPEVIIRIQYGQTDLYFWVIDDFTLSEAYDNDLQLKHFKLEWVDEDEFTEQSLFQYIPITQLGGTLSNFESSVLNFGENDQDNVTLTVDIQKNHESVFSTSTSNSWQSPLLLDTLKVDGGYAPTEFGHYSINWDFTQDQEEQNIGDNGAQVFFNVTDSIYSHADETSELSWAFGFERYGAEDGEEGWNIDHFMGTIFPIYADCEINSLSTYITGGLADGKIEFWYTLWWLPSAEEDPDGLGAVQWMTSEIVTLDSSQFNTWVTLPFDKDGETEFMMAGDIVYGGISYNNYNDDHLVRRSKSLAIGHDASIETNENVCIVYNGEGWEPNGFVNGRNLMIRLNINDNSNIIDGVDMDNTSTALGQNYPNPFNEQSTVEFELAQKSQVSFEIFDITGKKVMSRDLGHKPAGSHQINIQRDQLEAGMYFYKLKAGEFNETKQMIISK